MSTLCPLESLSARDPVTSDVPFWGRRVAGPPSLPVTVHVSALNVHVPGNALVLDKPLTSGGLSGEGGGVRGCCPPGEAAWCGQAWARPEDNPCPPSPPRPEAPLLIPLVCLLWFQRLLGTRHWRSPGTSVLSPSHGDPGGRAALAPLHRPQQEALVGGPLAGAILQQQAGVAPEGAAVVSSVHGRTPRGWPRCQPPRCAQEPGRR